MLLSFYPVDYAFLILLGLGSSLHCAGMCGPIACSYALPLASQKPSLLWSYHRVTPSEVCWSTAGSGH